VNAGLVEGKNLAVDGTLVEANASPHSRIRREKLHERLQISQSVQEYLSELEETNPVADTKMVSTTDADAVWAKKVGPAKMAYFDNYLIDTRSRVILGVEATPALFHQETVAARKMVDQIHKFGIRPETLAADKAYGSGEFLAWLLEHGVQPHIPVIDRRHQTGGSSRASSFVMNPRKMSTTVQREKPWLIAVGDGKAKATSIVPPRLSAGAARRRSAALLAPIVGCLCMSKNPSGRQSAYWSERQPTSAPG
jgi:hypothetical protein